MINNFNFTILNLISEFWLVPLTFSQVYFQNQNFAFFSEFEF